MPAPSASSTKSNDLTYDDLEKFLRIYIDLKKNKLLSGQKEKDLQYLREFLDRIQKEDIDATKNIQSLFAKDRNLREAEDILPFVMPSRINEGLRLILRHGAENGDVKSMMSLARDYVVNSRNIGDFKKAKEILEHILGSKLGNETQQTSALNNLNIMKNYGDFDKAEEELASFVKNKPNLSQKEFDDFAKSVSQKYPLFQHLKKIEPTYVYELSKKEPSKQSGSTRASAAVPASDESTDQGQRTAPGLTSNPIKVGRNTKTSGAAAPTASTSRILTDEERKKEALRLGMLARNTFYGFKGQKEDKLKGLELYEKAADLGNIDALQTLASWHVNNVHGIPKNEEKAKEYYKIIYDSGGVPDLKTMGTNEISLWFNASSEAEAEEEKRAAEKRSKNVSFAPNETKETAPTAPPSDEKRILTDEERKRVGERLRSLASDTFNGLNGQKQDRLKSRELYKQAADIGNISALQTLGNWYFNGDLGLPKDISKAKELYKKIYDSGKTLNKDSSNESQLKIWDEIVKEAEEEKRANIPASAPAQVKPTATASAAPAQDYNGAEQKGFNTSQKPIVEEYFKDLPGDDASSIAGSDFTKGWEEDVPEQKVDLPEVNLDSGVPDFEFQQEKDEDWRMAHARNAAKLALDELKRTDDINPHPTESPLDDLEAKAQNQLLNHVENRSQGVEERLRRKEYKKLSKDSPGFRVAKGLLNKSAKDFENSDLDQYINPYDKEVIAEMKKDFEDSLRKKIEALNSSFVGRNLYGGAREKAVENLTRDSEREWQRHKTSLLKDRLDQAYNKYFKEKEHALNTGINAAKISQEDRNLGLRNLSDWRTESNSAEAARFQNIGHVMALGEKNRALGTEMLRSQDQKLREANAMRNKKIDRYVSVATGHPLPHYDPAAPMQPQMQQTAPSAWTTAASVAPTIFNAMNAKRERDMREEQHNLQTQYYKNNPGVKPEFKFAEGGSVTDDLLNSLKKDMLKKQSDEADYYAKKSINADPVMEGLTNFGTAMLNRAPGDVGFSSIGNALQSANEGINNARQRSDEYSSKEIALRAAMYNTMRVAHKEMQDRSDKERDFSLKERKLMSTERHQKTIEDMKREELDLKKYSMSMPISKSDKFKGELEDGNVKDILKEGSVAAKSLENIRKAKQLRESQGVNVPYIGTDSTKFQDSLRNINKKYINIESSSSSAKADLERLNAAEMRALSDVKKAEFYKKKYLEEGLPIDEINKQWDEIISDIYEFGGQKKNQITHEEGDIRQSIPDAGNEEIPDEIKEIVSRNSDSYLTKLIKDTPRLARGLIGDVDKASQFIPSLIGKSLNKTETDSYNEKNGDGVLTKLYDFLTRDKFKPREGKESPGVRDIAGSAAESIAAIPDLVLAPTSHLVGKDLTLGKRAKNLLANPKAEENVTSELAGDAVGMLTGFGAAGKAAKLAKFEKLGEFLSSGTKLNAKNLGQAGLNLGLFNQYEEVLPEGALGTTAAAFLAAISPNASKKVIDEFSNKMKGVIKKVPPAQQKEVAQDMISRLKDDGFTPFVTTKDPAKAEGALEFLYRTTAKSIQDFVERSNLQKTAVHEGHAKNVSRIKEKIGIADKNISSELYGEGVKKGAQRYIDKTHKEGSKLLADATESIKPFNTKGVNKNIPGNKTAEFISKIEDSELKKFSAKLFSEYSEGLKTNKPVEIFKKADQTLKKINTEIAQFNPHSVAEKNSLEELKNLKDVFLGELDSFFATQPKKVGESYKKYREHYSKFYEDVAKTKHALGKDFKKLGTKDTSESFSETMSKFFEKDPNTFKEIAKHSTPKELKQFTDEVIFNLGVGTEQGTKNIFSPITFSKRFKDLPKENATRLEEIFRKSNPNSKESLSEVVELIDILSPKTPQELKVKALPKTSESLFTFSKNVGLRLFNLMFSPRLLGSMLSKDGLINKKFSEISKNFTKKEWSDFLKNITNDLHKDKRFDDPKHELIKTRLLKSLNEIKK